MLLAAAAGLVLMMAFALAAEANFAASGFPGWFHAQSSPQFAAAERSADVVAEQAVDWADQPCGADCDGCCAHPFSGHCPNCSGGLVAPALIGLLVPALSGDRLAIANATAAAGTSRPPDERPPRWL